MLPVVSKIFHVDNFLSLYLCGYRKEFSTQQPLLSAVEKWNSILDKKRYANGPF